MPENIYSLMGPVHPTHPHLGQRILASGPELAELKAHGHSIITNAYQLAPYLHIVEIPGDWKPGDATTIYVPTVLNLEPEILIFWADINSVFQRSYN